MHPEHLDDLEDEFAQHELAQVDGPVYDSKHELHEQHGEKHARNPVFLYVLGHVRVVTDVLKHYDVIVTSL